MNSEAHLPRTVAWSAGMHVLVVALLLFATYIAQRNFKDPVRFIELVSGPGDDYTATVAPALGNPVLLKAPEDKSLPRSDPIPEQPSPATVPAPIQAVQNPKAPAPTPKTPAPPAQPASKSITKDEFDKQNANKKQPAPAKAPSPKVQKIDVPGILKGAAGGSTANQKGGAGGKALTREEAAQMDLYYSHFRTMLREAIASQPGLSRTVTARLNVTIAANGTLSNPKIVRSSGNAEFDRAILAAVDRIKTALKARPGPDKKSEQVELDINLRDASAL